MTDNGGLTVLFDVDGTLVDSNYLHTLAWSRALRSSDEWAPMNAIHRLIGMGSESLLRLLIGREDPTIAKRWRHEYEQLIAEVAPFPGARHVLEHLKRLDVRVVLATSSPAEHLDHMVRLLDADRYIDAVTTADDVARTKPDPEIFLTAAARVEATGPIVVVGDSTRDVAAAEAARFPCIGVESGGFSDAELINAGAIAAYRDVAHLDECLATGPLSAWLG